MRELLVEMIMTTGRKKNIMERNITSKKKKRKDTIAMLLGWTDNSLQNKLHPTWQISFLIWWANPKLSQSNKRVSAKEKVSNLIFNSKISKANCKVFLFISDPWRKSFLLKKSQRLKKIVNLLKLERSWFLIWWIVSRKNSFNLLLRLKTKIKN